MLNKVKTRKAAQAITLPAQVIGHDSSPGELGTWRSQTKALEEILNSCGPFSDALLQGFEPIRLRHLAARARATFGADC